MTAKKCLPLLAILLILFCASVSYAAQSSISIKPGYVYIFSGGDERAISYVAVTGGGRYEYAVESADGEILDYGIANRSPVRGGGRTYISASDSGAVSVSYDSAKVSVATEEGQALTRISLNKGESATITNNFDKQLTITVDNTGRDGYAAYDSAVRDGWGDIVLFQRETRLSIQNIPSASSATFTAGEGGLTMMAPGVWLDREISWERDDRPALTTLPLALGQAVSLTNEGDDIYETVVYLKGGSFEYDYMIKDAQGFTIETETGIKNNRIRINAKSTITVTPRVDGALLYYPGDWTRDITVRTQALVTDASYTVEPGKTYVITNTDPDYPHSVRIENQLTGENFKYDYSLQNEDTVNYATEYSVGEMSLPPGGVLTLTARDDTLVIKLPSAVSSVSAAPGDKPAVSYYPVARGGTLVITNADPDYPQSVRIENAEAGRNFQFDYALTEVDTVSYASRYSAGEMSLPPNGELTLTALDEALVIKIPGAVTSVSVKKGAKAAVSYYQVEPNETLVIKNTDADYPHAVRIENAQSGRNFKFDYAVEDEGATSFASEYSAGEMSVPPSAVLTLTARDEALVVRLPSSNDKLNIASGASPALIYAQMRAGVSFIAGNNGGEPITITALKGDKDGFWDYLRCDDENEIVSYGRAGTGQPYTLEPGETTHFTNTEDFAVRFVFPASLLTQGLYASLTDAPALYRRVLTYGEALAVTNKDKTYSNELTVAEEDNKPADYDYAAVGAKGELQSFGIGSAGVVQVKNSETFIIAPQSGSALSVRYPYEMHGTVFTAADTAAPLHRITLAPGEKVTFTNKSWTKEYVINNNSGAGSAAYYLRDRANTKPIGRNETPVTGDISIPSNDTVTITAATGDDLKIWLPVEWVEDLLR
jgi:hypothetical protein